ncbi:hypothetical protein REPUB_Repub02eG0019900 [Reevesia pubescens]
MASFGYRSVSKVLVLSFILVLVVSKHDFHDLNFDDYQNPESPLPPETPSAPGLLLPEPPSPPPPDAPLAPKSPLPLPRPDAPSVPRTPRIPPEISPPPLTMDCKDECPLLCFPVPQFLYQLCLDRCYCRCDFDLSNLLFTCTNNCARSMPSSFTLSKKSRSNPLVHILYLQNLFINTFLANFTKQFSSSIFQIAQKPKTT